MRSVCIDELYVTVNNMKISSLCTKRNALMANFCCRQQSNVRRSSCRVSDIFVRILAKFGVSEQIVIKVTWYQVSRKSVQWQPRCYMEVRRTYGHGEANRRFLLFEWTRLKTLDVHRTFNFTIVWPCIITYSMWIKPTDALNSSFIGITTLHVSGSLSAHHQEFLAVQRLRPPDIGQKGCQKHVE
jgi:hypothetical protein